MTQNPKLLQKSFWFLFILIFGCSERIWSDEVISIRHRSSEILNLDQLVAEVRSHNRSIKAARANWEAMKERVPQARAWEDLRAGVDVERMGTTRFHDYSNLEWMASQEIPITGKNKVRGRIATAEAASALAELRRREIEVITRAKAAYYRFANAYIQHELNLKNQELLRQLGITSRAKYETGTQTQTDILAVETDLVRLEEADADIRRQISEQQSELNVLMNRPPQLPIARPAISTLRPLNLSLERLYSLALEHRPELLVAEARVNAADARLDLSRRQWIPDPEIRVEARQYKDDGGIREYDTGIFFNIPWLNPAKYSAGVRESKKMLESGTYERDATRTETLGLVRDQVKKIETFQHHYQLFKNQILPLAEQGFTAKRLGYETGKESFLDLLTAQRNLQELEAMTSQHLTDYHISMFELEAIIGTQLEDVPASSSNEPMEESK